MIDVVECAADPRQRYALYVPSNYSGDRPWPVIFCFDPGARGRVPVERFQAAAERYGYVVAGSLNSRNGPWAANAAAANAMFADVARRFHLDPERLYTAGLSGGARVATALALEGTSRGVIAGGAGFPPLPNGVPLKVGFPFFGTVGTEDFNHGEFERLERDLADRTARYRIVEFAGGHEWAPAVVLAEAVAWLELQAIRDYRRPLDPDFVAACWRDRIAAIPATGPARWRALRSVTADFGGLADTAAFAQELRTMESGAQLKAELKAERALAAREDALLAELENAARSRATRRKAAVENINRAADALEDSADRRVARRARNGFIAMTRERTSTLLDQGQAPLAADMLAMADCLRPGQPRTLFDLARARALGGDRTAALDALERAAAAGFTDAPRAENDPALQALRADPRFAAALAHMDAEASGPLELAPMQVAAALASVELRPFFLPNAGGGDLPLSLLRVDHVAPRSAAARAGIKIDMEIIAIQGIRVRGLLEADLQRLMALPVRTEILLTVREPPGKKERIIRIPTRQPATTSPSAPATATAPP